MATKISQCGQYLSLVGALAAAGCGGFEPSATALPELAVRIDAPAAYRDWFARTEACSGLQAAFQAVEWYVVEGVDQFLVDGAPRVGMWQVADGKSQIVIAGNYASHEMVVRHEMLHHLLGREGHPKELFEQRCQLTWESWGLRGASTVAGAH